MMSDRERDNPNCVFRIFNDKNNTKNRVSVMGTLLTKPVINFNRFGEFIEMKLTLHSQELCPVEVTLVCNVTAESIPRIHLKPITLGSFVVIRNLEKMGYNNLHGDMRIHEIEILNLNLTRIDSDLQAFHEVKTD